jgi:hypothetical protein
MLMMALLLFLLPPAAPCPHTYQTCKPEPQ